MNADNHNSIVDQNIEMESFWSIWETQRNGLDKGISELSNFDRSVSIFGGINQETISNSIVGQNASIKDNSHPLIISNNIETISLSDMLKTNCCSRKEIAQSYENIAAFDKNSLSLRTPTEWDGLEDVSNRKLQNKANSKRAREKRKEEWEQLKQIIEELKIENKHLKSRLGNHQDRGINASRNGNENKKFCKKCLSDMMDEEYESESSEDNTSNRKGSNSMIMLEKEKNKRVNLKNGIKYKNELENNFEQNTSKEINYAIKDKESEIEFEEFDFNINVGEHEYKNENKAKGKGKGKEWKGKIWIALGILMMVIGINIHGIQGSGEKSIRINEYEMKRWTEDLYNPDVDAFTIKMKSKVENNFIQSEKDSEAELGEKNNWNYLGKQGKMSKKIRHQELKTDKSDSESQKNILDVLSFEPDELYNRRMSYEEDEEEAELRIDKDLLFSIQAEFDDIGRYI